MCFPEIFTNSHKSPVYIITEKRVSIKVDIDPLLMYFDYCLHKNAKIACLQYLPD